jgi:hypothetical protein
VGKGKARLGRRHVGVVEHSVECGILLGYIFVVV